MCNPFPFKHSFLWRATLKQRIKDTLVSVMMEFSQHEKHKTSETIQSFHRKVELIIFPTVRQCLSEFLDYMITRLENSTNSLLRTEFGKKPFSFLFFSFLIFLFFSFLLVEIICITNQTLPRVNRLNGHWKIVAHIVLRLPHEQNVLHRLYFQTLFSMFSF